MEINGFSLLHPKNTDAGCKLLDNNTINDLSIDFIADFLTDNENSRRVFRDILINMPVNREIIEYRRAVYKDLSSNPDVCRKLYEIFENMSFFVKESRFNTNKPSIWQLIDNMRALQNYVDSVSAINEALADRQFSSSGMNELKNYINEVYTQSGFSELEEDLKFLGEDAYSFGSITLGVNIDSCFTPYEAGIISINKYPFGEMGMLEKFMHFHGKNNPEDKDLKPFTMIQHQKKRSTGENPLMNNLTRIIEQMLPSLTDKLKKILKKYVDISCSALASCIDEISFYYSFIKLEERLKEFGLPVSLPKISENKTDFKDIYNVKLAMCFMKEKSENKIICNNLHFSSSENILILTGPNRGGKTIITQAAGLAQLMFQHGLAVPCSEAEIQISDGIYTHFPADENQTVSLGRLGEESDRFSRIADAATEKSLILMNESFATTSHTESLYIAKDVVKYLCCLGARTIFNTHMHELGENTDEFICEKSVCRAASVIMGKNKDSNSFKISYEKPDGKSFAHDIAYKYGITFEQLNEKLN